MPTRLPLVASVDHVGALASVACLVHCAILPFAAAFLPTSLVLGDSETTHAALVVLVVPLALAAFLRGYRIHGRGAIPVVGTAMALVLLGAVVAEGRILGHQAAERLTWAASLVLIGCHLGNHRHCHRAVGEARTCCDPGAEPVMPSPAGSRGAFLVLLLACAGVVVLGRSSHPGHAHHADSHHERGDDHEDHDHDHDDHRHHHESPHGGTLVPLGDHVAHLEVVPDASSGELVVYVLDAEAERGVPVSGDVLRLRLTPEGRPPFSLELRGVSNPLTGELAGQSSEFRGRHEGLEGVERLEVFLEAVEVRGMRFEAISAEVPGEGGEG